MQLHYENFGVEGDPHELAIFAKNYDADEIRMSECCDKEYFANLKIEKIEIKSHDKDGSSTMEMDDKGNVVYKASRILSTIPQADNNEIEENGESMVAKVLLKDGREFKVKHIYQSFDMFRNEVYSTIRRAIHEGIFLIPIGNMMINYNHIELITQ